MKWTFSTLALVVALAAFGLVSCNKVKELYQTASDKVKEMKDKNNDADSAGISEVVSVSESEGKEIILNEDRLVMLEFYTDT